MGSQIYPFVSPKDRKPKVFVGMSGGVDSSVAAALLQRQGYDVTGVFIKVWQPDFVACTSGDDRRDATRVAVHLGIPFVTLDLAEVYKREVADYLVAEYRAGRTPNPDVMCNRHVKFGAFLSWALANGADAVATGHYANVLPPVGETGGAAKQAAYGSRAAYKLTRSVDENKDQTYFLWTLGQEALSHIFFPVGCYTKPEVRKLAQKFDLPTADKKESQGVCFIGKFDMRSFLAHYITPVSGEVLSLSGERVGTHEGAAFYTIGQRHGFDVAARTAHTTPLYVVAKDITANTITVADRPNSAIDAAHTHTALLRGTNWIAGAPLTGRYHVRIRHRQALEPCELFFEDERVRITFERPQWGIASGQSAVVYDGDVCLGGGVIV